MRVRRRYLVVALLGVTVATLAAQRRNFFGGGCELPVEGNPSYDGRLTFVRLRYPGCGATSSRATRSKGIRRMTDGSRSCDSAIRATAE